MGEQHEFDWIGVVDGVEYDDGHKLYVVKILKNKNGYRLRDAKSKSEILYKKFHAPSLQDLGNNLYCAYD